MGASAIILLPIPPHGSQRAERIPSPTTCLASKPAQITASGDKEGRGSPAPHHRVLCKAPAPPALQLRFSIKLTATVKFLWDDLTVMKRLLKKAKCWSSMVSTFPAKLFLEEHSRTDRCIWGRDKAASRQPKLQLNTQRQSQKQVLN